MAHLWCATVNPNNSGAPLVRHWYAT